MKEVSKIALLILLYFPLNILAQSVEYSKHNLSLSSTNYRQTSTVQSICEFCHTPHAPTPASPAWRKSNPGTRYIMYDQMTSSTSNIPADPSRQPDGSSILCLSCHDGTIAMGNMGNTQGNSINNSHLINFDLSIVKPRKNGELYFKDNGYRSGSCTILCHGSDHNSRKY